MPAKTIPELHEMQRTMWRIHPSSGRSYGWWEEIGPKFSPEAVQEVFEAVREHRLVCELTSVGFGFGQIGLAGVEPPLQPVTPQVTLFEHLINEDP